MRIGIIDFGTNTVRLDIFETEGRSYMSIYDSAVFSRVIENTVGSALSQDGIEHVIQAIEEHQAACRHFRCDRVECFATASLRYIDNADNVLEQVEFRTGIEIEMISGEKEAEYDFLALRSVTAAEKGIGCDLGGGSLQLFTFDKTGAKNSKSFPLGSSRVAKQFVSGLIPTEKELENIKNEVKARLGEAGFGPEAGGETLFAMGGTAKALGRICEKVLNIKGAPSLSEITAVLKIIAEEPAETLEFFEEFEPKRAKTLGPGTAVLAGIMEQTACSKIEIYPVGVREGFLEKLMEEGAAPGRQSLLDIVLAEAQKGQKR